MVTARPEMQDPVLKLVSKYQKGQNVDYKVGLLHGQWLTWCRKSKTKSFEATSRKCNRRSVK
jgi:hypothetical protein